MSDPKGGPILNLDPLAEALLPKNTKKYSHYFRDVSKFKFMDIYRLLSVFNVTNPAIQHAIKKLIVPGMRTAGKPTRQDLEEAIASIQRAIEMLAEDEASVPELQTKFG